MTDNSIFAMNPMRPLTLERWVYAALEARSNPVSATRMRAEPPESDAPPSSHELVNIPSERAFIEWIAKHKSITPVSAVLRALLEPKEVVHWRTNYLAQAKELPPLWDSLEQWLQAERNSWNRQSTTPANEWRVQCELVDWCYFRLDRLRARLPADDLAFIDAVISQRESSCAKLIGAYFQSPTLLESDRRTIKIPDLKPNPEDPLELDRDPEDAGEQSEDDCEAVVLRLDKTLVDALRSVAAYQRLSLDEVCLGIFKEGLPYLTLTME